MIAAGETACAMRAAVVAWPSADLPRLLDANEAVVCCTRVRGGPGAIDTLVRDILGSEADFAYSPSGKPYLPARGPVRPHNFNISHSGDVLIVALSRSAEVGVDVERVRAVPEWRRIADRTFDTAARAQLLADIACGADEDETFIRAWCRHEAFVKATGEGLFPSNTRDDANDCNAGRAQLRVIDLPELPLPAGAGRYRGALALLQ